MSEWARTFLVRGALPQRFVMSIVADGKTSGENCIAGEGMDNGFA